MGKRGLRHSDRQFDFSEIPIKFNAALVLIYKVRITLNVAAK